MSDQTRPIQKTVPFRGATTDNGMISVRLSRKLSNDVTIELGVSHAVVYHTEDELSEIYADILSTLNNEIRVQVAKLVQSSQGMPNGAVGSSNVIETENGHVVIDVNKIAVEMKNGKRLYKVLGGKWERYGVRLWLDPQVCSDELADMLGRAIPDEHGILKTPHLRATLEMNGDKPSRVMRIWRGEE